jgi:hypothetical protein
MILIEAMIMASVKCMQNISESKSHHGIMVNYDKKKLHKDHFPFPLTATKRLIKETNKNSTILSYQQFDGVTSLYIFELK